jgi:hypothetical protein
MSTLAGRTPPNISGQRASNASIRAASPGWLATSSATPSATDLPRSEAWCHCGLTTSARKRSSSAGSSIRLR